VALNWKDIDLVRVPSRPAGGGFWTLTQDFSAGSRLLRIRVINQDRDGNSLPVLWSLSAGATGVSCGPDGDPTTSRTGLLCTSAACGALIGKIGGSTADIPDTTSGANPYTGKKVFAVGKDCILSLPTAADGGPLFLTMNDKPDEFAGHAGELQVLLQHFPL
jgi:hypothetical protein